MAYRDILREEKIILDPKNINLPEGLSLDRKIEVTLVLEDTEMPYHKDHRTISINGFPDYVGWSKPLYQGRGVVVAEKLYDKLLIELTEGRYSVNSHPFLSVSIDNLTDLKDSLKKDSKE